MKVFVLENKLLTNGIISLQVAEGKSCTQCTKFIQSLSRGQISDWAKVKEKFWFRKTKMFLMIRAFLYQMEDPSPWKYFIRGQKSPESIPLLNINPGHTYKPLWFSPKAHFSHQDSVFGIPSGYHPVTCLAAPTRLFSWSSNTFILNLCLSSVLWLASRINNVVLDIALPVSIDDLPDQIKMITNKNGNVTVVK